MVFISFGDVIVFDFNKIFVFSEIGNFISSIGNEYLINFFSFFVGYDNYLIVCDKGDKKVKVFFFNGIEMVRLFSVSDCSIFFEFVICY